LSFEERQRRPWIGIGRQFARALGQNHLPHQVVQILPQAKTAFAQGAGPDPASHGRADGARQVVRAPRGGCPPIGGRDRAVVARQFLFAA
jgi:hypothetical protein